MMDDRKRQSEPAAEQETTTNRARQAVTGHNVHRVLLFGLIGVLLAYMVLFFVR